MKQKIFCVICLAVGISCYAQNQYDFENQEYYFHAYYDDLITPPLKLSFFNGSFYMDVPALDDWEEDKQIKGSIQGKYIIREENGFIYILVAEKKYLVLYRETLVCVLIDCQNNDAFFGLNKDSSYVSVGEGIRPFIGITGKSPWEHDNKVSSFLTETIRGKTIEYNGSHENYYYELIKPWVEGRDDYGIGEWLETKPAGNVCGIVFFNGYIDPNRPDLYYANSRIKEVQVTTKDYSWTFQIEDTPNPQILPLPDGFNDILHFTIKDVYKGTRYSDTCLAGIYFLRVRGQ